MDEKAIQPQQAAQAASNGATEIQLQYPVEVDGVRYEGLKLRRPRVRDMLAADKSNSSESDKETRMFANLCEVAPAFIEELDLADYRNVQEVYKGFLSSAQRTQGEPA